MCLKYSSLILMLVLTGCGLNLPVPTLDTQRETSGKFDGTWSLESRDKIGNCRANYKRAYMEVKNGVGKIASSSHGSTAFISTKGHFRIDVPGPNAVVHKYGGNLLSSKGRVLIEYSPHWVTDCSVGISIKKVN